MGSSSLDAPGGAPAQGTTPVRAPRSPPEEAIDREQLADALVEILRDEAAREGLEV